MMRTYHLTILSPDGEIFSGQVISLILRGADGDLAVMSGHVPLITTVKPGKCVLTLPDESEKEGYLKSGILNVSKDGITLLVGQRDIWTE